MPKEITFQLDVEAAGRIILQDMVTPIVDQATNAIAARAQSMAASQGSEVIFGTNTKVGIIKRGKRTIGTVAPIGAKDAHDSYIANSVLAKAKDAGRLN